MLDSSPDAPPLVVGVRLRSGGPVYDFDPRPLRLHLDDRVVVETDRGPIVGTVAVAPLRRPVSRALRRVLKLADARELSREDRLAQQEVSAFRTAVELVRGQNLPMKMVRAEMDPDGGRVIFVFASDDRVDFRDLVRELAQRLHTRVEMRQVGSRDEASQSGGLGVCGRELCCSSWLREFQPVSVKMVKAQGLSLNPAKLAGQCGRLKCCLRYEYQSYVDLKKGLPNMGASVDSVKGSGQVVGQNILKQTVTLRLEGDGEVVEVTRDDLVTKRPPE